MPCLIQGRRATQRWHATDNQWNTQDRFGGCLLLCLFCACWARSCCGGSTAPGWKDSARRFNPFVVDGSTDRSHVNADLVSNLLHLERLKSIRAPFKEAGLVIDDFLSHTLQRIATLFDGIN